MPTINILKKINKRDTNHKDTDARLLRRKAYASTSWKKLRLSYLKEHAVCQRCLSKGKITSATSVHHIKSPFKDGEINWNLLLDYTNLMSVCHECHAEIHNEQNGHKSPKQIIEELDKLFEDVDIGDNN